MLFIPTLPVEIEYIAKLRKLNSAKNAKWVGGGGGGG